MGYKNTERHLIACIRSWIGYYTDDKDYKDKMSVLIFEKIYLENNKYFWDEKEYDAWSKENYHCNYCGISENESILFYKHVQSNRYTRGKKLEIDRRICQMRFYLDSEEKKAEFFNLFVNRILDSYSDLKDTHGFNLNELINNKIQKIIKDGDKSTLKEEILYLPAPYKKDNCVWACYWCNNAKTDAFTDEEFGPIGEKIGEQIKKILNRG